jgi:hypothetical protein
MKVTLRTKKHTVYKKKSGRFAVKDAEKNWVNGDDKVAVLLAEGLVKTAPPAVAEAPVEETTVEEAPVEEAPVEEALVEEAPVEEAPVEEAPEKESTS